MTPPLVSVVIQTHSDTRFLAEAVESVLVKSGVTLDVIVVDDGSDVSIADALAAYGGRVRIVRQPHLGVAHARNRGASVARANLLAFLDADDVSAPDRLAKQAAVLLAHDDVILVAGDAWTIDEHGQRTGLRSEREPGPRRPHDFRWDTVEYCAIPSTVMIRKPAFDAIGGFPTNLGRRSAGEDWLAWARAAALGRMVYLTEPVAGYRRHDGNSTNQTEAVATQMRLASYLLAAAPELKTCPRRFRAEALIFRGVTAARVEPPAAAAAYILSGLATNPMAVSFLGRAMRRGFANWRARRG